MKTWRWPLACAVLLTVLGLWWIRRDDPREMGSSSDSVSSLSHPSPEPESASSISLSSSAIEEQPQREPVAVETRPVAAPANTPPPVAVIRVLAQDVQGRSVSGVRVVLDVNQSLPGLFELGVNHGDRVSATGAIGPQGWGAVAATNADGMVEFRVEDPAHRQQPAHLSLSGTKTTGSATLAVPLVSQTVVVTMQSCARVDVSVLDAGGRPLPGTFVDLQIRSRPAGTVGLEQSPRGFKKTDAAGLAVFDELLAGEYEFTCRDTSTGGVTSELVEVRLGQHSFVELRLPSDPAKPVAVAGTVVDEVGSPLPKIQVRLRVDGGPRVAVLSNDQGAFSHSAPPGREVEVEVGGGMWDDDFEPSFQRVPFGTRDLRLARAREVEWMSVEFVCLDASTNQPVSGNRLTWKRYRASAPEERASFRFLTGGRATLMFKERDDWHVVVGGYHHVDAENGFHYVEEDVALAGAMTSVPAGKQVVIRLRRLPD